MAPEILQRIILAGGLVVLSLAVYQVVNRFLLGRATGKIYQLAAYHPGRAAIVYFTTPTCAPCKTIQRPALERIQSAMGDHIQVIEIDAAAQPKVANEWGVLSVPTTILVDHTGQPRHINHGVTTAEQLKNQLMELLK